MPINNAINAGTNSVGWTAFTTSITATTTDPVLGAGATTSSHFLQFGGILFVTFYLINVATTTAGSGTYLFSMPPQFTINTNIVPSLGSNSSIGYSGGRPSGAFSAFYGGAYVFDSHNYAMKIYDSASNRSNLVNSTNYPLSNGSNYTSDLQVPII